MNEKLYKILAFIGRIGLPALATLYLALADLWHLPLKTEIAGTMSALSAFMNTVLSIDSSKFFSDKMIVEEVELDDGIGDE